MKNKVLISIFRKIYPSPSHQQLFTLVLVLFFVFFILKYFGPPQILVFIVD